MVIDNTAQSYNIEDVISFYKAQPGLEYRLGTPEYWRFGTVNYSSDDEGGCADNDVYHAGLSKRDRERASAIKVNKKYPELEDEEYKPVVPGAYASVYRDNSTLKPPAPGESKSSRHKKTGAKDKKTTTKPKKKKKKNPQ